MKALKLQIEKLRSEFSNGVHLSQFVAYGDQFTETEQPKLYKTKDLSYDNDYITRLEYWKNTILQDIQVLVWNKQALVDNVQYSLDTMISNYEFKEKECLLYKEKMKSIAEKRLHTEKLKLSEEIKNEEDNSKRQILTYEHDIHSKEKELNELSDKEKQMKLYIDQMNDKFKKEQSIDIDLKQSFEKYISQWKLFFDKNFDNLRKNYIHKVEEFNTHIISNKETFHVKDIRNLIVILNTMIVSKYPYPPFHSTILIKPKIDKEVLVNNSNVNDNIITIDKYLSKYSSDSSDEDKN
jgi:hypothetical protein